MIVPMQKIQIVVRCGDRDRLLADLAGMGMVHVQPVEPARAVADDALTAAMEKLSKAIQAVQTLEPAGGKPALTVFQAEEEILAQVRAEAETDSRLTALHRQLEQQAIWGDARLADIETLNEAGVTVRFYAVPANRVAQCQGQPVFVLNELNSRVVVAAVGPEPQLPAGSEALTLPRQDNPQLRQEAAELNRRRQEAAQRLRQLAGFKAELLQRKLSLQDEINFNIAQRGAWQDESLFALQGWLPKARIARVPDALKQSGIDAGVRFLDPDGEETPPTLIEYPAWARPIEGLFSVLGTVAGYREFDVSVPFMLALPVFAAILIGDLGYGAVLFFGLLFAYKKVGPALGREFTQLIMVIGAVTMIWGVLCGSFFGFPIFSKPLIPVDMSDESRRLMMNISFVMGAIHLSVAQLWQGVRLAPHLKMLNKAGWALIIWGMLGVVRMFVLDGPMGWQTPWPYLLLSGAVLAILFSSPQANLFKMVFIGLAEFPLSMLSAFSDVFSYVRLMAVGLAGGVLAVSFNELALSTGHWYTAIPIMIFGHALNLSLALISLFAHGVRLNMLEFSNNLGMQWVGYAYKPFTRHLIQES